MSKKKLTIKQEGFCQDYISCGNLTEAYRLNYSTSNMKPATANRAAKALIDNSKISTRIDELRKTVKRKHNITIDFMVEGYTNALKSAIKKKDHSAQAKILDSLSKFLGNSETDKIKIKLLEKQYGKDDNADEQQISININV